MIDSFSAVHMILETHGEELDISIRMILGEVQGFSNLLKPLVQSLN